MINATLCWDCARAIGDCAWSKEFKPIPGWKAEGTHKSTVTNSYDGYIVYSCPLFKRDATNGGLKRYKENK